MRHLVLRFLLITPMLALITLGPGAVSAVLAAPCGAGGGPCSCGDTVITNTQLSGTDPVLRALCPGVGLDVASHVTLKINGTIRGTILLLADPRTGIATEVVVTTGTIDGA